MNFETFKNAPITEALLDIRTELSLDASFENFEEYFSEIEIDFPKKQVSIEYKAEFKVEKDNVPTSNLQSKSNGFIFKDDLNSKIIQFRLDGFTFNKLKPYESWNAFVEEAKKHWEKYCEIAEPIKITRIALRFINKIIIPGGEPELKDYIALLPVIPEKLPQKYSEFFLRNVFFDEKHDIKSIITETIDLNEKTDVSTPFILDVDVFKENPKGLDSKKLWEDFNDLRECKNNIFFNITTPKCQSLFR